MLQHCLEGYLSACMVRSAPKREFVSVVVCLMHYVEPDGLLWNTSIIVKYQRIVGADPTQGRTVRNVQRHDPTNNGASTTNGTQRLPLYNLGLLLASIAVSPTREMYMLLCHSTGHVSWDCIASETDRKRTNSDACASMFPAKLPQNSQDFISWIRKETLAEIILSAMASITSRTSIRYTMRLHSLVD
jgi:hypothetical protein